MTESLGIKIADRRAAYLEEIEEKPSATNQTKSPAQNVKNPEPPTEDAVPPGMTSRSRGYVDGSHKHSREASPVTMHVSEIALFMLELLLQKAFAAMGSIPNPATGRRECDMEQAKTTLDLLGAVAETMRGRWEMPGVEQDLDAQLTNLRLQYAKLAPDLSKQV